MPIERHQCEFFLVRYVPDPVRDEFVHIGVLLREPGANGGKGRLALKFTADWRRVRCLDPDADTGMLEGLESELRRRFEAEAEGNLMHVLEDSFSNCVQVTRAKGYLAESVETGVEELMRLYVEPQRRERLARLSGRAAIQARMRTEFERAGVWDLLRKRIRAAEYTRPGDPMRIDLGYRNGVVKMFQAVSLEPAAGMGLEMAKVLAFSAPRLMVGVERVEKVPLELTAIVEPARLAVGRLGKYGTGLGGLRAGGVGMEGSGLGGRERSGLGAEERERFGLGAEGRETNGDEGWDEERLAQYRFAVETMEEHRIRVLTTADLGRVAETARRELRV